MAGLSAIVWGGYCELQAMWVEESLRNRGLAHALFAGAEAEGRRRGCALVVFHAYDLLARGLYERLGYETVGVIENCPAGKRCALVPQGPVSAPLRRAVPARTSSASSGAGSSATGVREGRGQVNCGIPPGTDAERRASATVTIS